MLLFHGFSVFVLFTYSLAYLHKCQWTKFKHVIGRISLTGSSVTVTKTSGYYQRMYRIMQFPDKTLIIMLIGIDFIV